MRAARAVEAEHVAAAALGAIPIAALGAADGGFYPRPWGWATVGFALTLVVVIVTRPRIDISRNVVLLLSALAALAAWTATSLLWSRSIGATVFELERLLLYASAIAVAALVVRRRTARALAAGVLLGAGTLAVWGLVSYLLTRERAPDPLQGWYLHQPLGYANGMAITAAIAILLGLGIAIETRSRAVRVLAAASLVPLASALSLTGSRAAWAALLVGALAWFAVSRDRRQLLSFAPLLVCPAVAALIMAASGVTDTALVEGAAGRLGTQLLIAVTALAGAAAFVASSRIAALRIPCAPGRAATVVVVTSFVVAGIYGASNPHLLAGDRSTYWRVAATEFSERPLLGSGAGSYGQIWLERRPEPVAVRDAHSFPIETAAELGVVGLALVLVLLAAPLAWSIRARRSPHVPAVAGAFAAFTAHTAVDWDWELPSVALAALFCAVAVGVSADTGSRLQPALWQRTAAVAVGAGALALGLAGFVGASAVEDANRALAQGDHARAQQAAQRAERWQPWAVDPTLIRGRSLLALGDRDRARASFVRAAAREPNDYRAWLALAAVSEGEAIAAALERARTLNRFAVARP